MCGISSFGRMLGPNPFGAAGGAEGYELINLSVVQVTESVVDEDGNPRSVAFNNDGSKIFIAGDSNNSIYEYNL